MSNGFLYLATVLIWGSTWIAIEFQLGTVAPEVSIFYRYLLAAALLFSWCRYRGLKLDFDRRAHGKFFMLGVLLFSLNYITAYHAQIYITSAMTAICFSTMVWMNIINARLFFGTRSDFRVVGGSLLGVIGIAVLFVPQIEEFTLSDATLVGGGLAVSGAFLASLGNMVSQASQKQGLPIIQSNAWGMLYGALLTGSVAAVQGLPFNFDTSQGYVLSLLYLSVAGSILAFGSYLTLLGRIGAHKAGYAMVMFPVVALILSVLFEGLQLSNSILAGMALVLAGNVFILRGAGRSTQPVSSQPDNELRLATERLQ
ncbi:MAG: EamA family transporter [Woeseiaceae bacterium]|nr:EamA family transporter [Woeseiaceae bacterium]